MRGRGFAVVGAASDFDENRAPSLVRHEFLLHLDGAVARFPLAVHSTDALDQLLLVSVLVVAVVARPRCCLHCFLFVASY